MNNTIAIQIYLFLVFAISGIAIGVIFDLFRILRKSFNTPDILTYLEDILFWIFTGITFIFFLFKFNSGEIRNYVIIGLIAGVLLYMLTISNYFIKLNLLILKYIKMIFSYITKILKSILKIIFKPFVFIVINTKKPLKNYTKRIKSRINEVLSTKKRKKCNKL